MRKLLEKGEIAEDDYMTWRRTKLMQGQHSYAMVNNMADYMVNIDSIAASVINTYMPEVYAINGNYTTYKIESHFGINTHFDLVDEQTVERLVRQKPDLLPKAKINIPKDKKWNKQHLTSAVTQSILQGETVEQMASRLAAVSDMDRNSAIRNARTMTTRAQNGGRMDAYERAQGIGVKGLKHRWLAALDGRTRDSHRAIDGDVVEIGKKFKNGLEFPGDPHGAPEEVYNCRCTTISAFDDSEFNGAEGRSQHIWEKDSKYKNMSYEQWKHAKGDEPIFKAPRNAKRDENMRKEYRELLGKKIIPDNVRDFQEIKYGEPDKWKKLKSTARIIRNQKRQR